MWTSTKSQFEKLGKILEIKGQIIQKWRLNYNKHKGGETTDN